MELEFFSTKQTEPDYGKQVLVKHNGEWRILIKYYSGWTWNGGLTDPPSRWAYLP